MDRALYNMPSHIPSRPSLLRHESSTSTLSLPMVDASPVSWKPEPVETLEQRKQKQEEMQKWQWNAKRSLRKAIKSEVEIKQPTKVLPYNPILGARSNDKVNDQSSSSCTPPKNQSYPQSPSRFLFPIPSRSRAPPPRHPPVYLPGNPLFDPILQEEINRYRTNVLDKPPINDWERRQRKFRAYSESDLDPTLYGTSLAELGSLDFAQRNQEEDHKEPPGAFWFLPSERIVPLSNCSSQDTSSKSDESPCAASKVVCPSVAKASLPHATQVSHSVAPLRSHFSAETLVDVDGVVEAEKRQLAITRRVSPNTRQSHKGRNDSIETLVDGEVPEAVLVGKTFAEMGRGKRKEEGTFVSESHSDDNGDDGWESDRGKSMLLVYEGIDGNDAGMGGSGTRLGRRSNTRNIKVRKAGKRVEKGKGERGKNRKTLHHRDASHEIEEVVDTELEDVDGDEQLGRKNDTSKNPQVPNIIITIDKRHPGREPATKASQTETKIPTTLRFCPPPSRLQAKNRVKQGRRR